MRSLLRSPHRFFQLSCLLVALAACAGPDPRGSTSQYPYPPQFVSPAEVPPTTLAQPPQPGSQLFEAELSSIIAQQALLDAAQKKTIWTQDKILPAVIVQPVLGKHITPERFPVFYVFMNHVASDAWRIGDFTRDYWKSPRPWYADNRVQLLVPAINTYGYPSGHTVTYGTWAWVLSEMVPQKRLEFFQRAYGVADNRIAGGAHFPHDIEGGRLLAIAVYERMRTNPAYRAEYNEALAELRRGLRARQ